MVVPDLLAFSLWMVPHMPWTVRWKGNAFNKGSHLSRQRMSFKIMVHLRLLKTPNLPQCDGTGPVSMQPLD